MTGKYTVEGMVDGHPIQAQDDQVNLDQQERTNHGCYTSDTHPWTMCWEHPNYGTDIRRSQLEDKTFKNRKNILQANQRSFLQVNEFTPYNPPIYYRTNGTSAAPQFAIAANQFHVKPGWTAECYTFDNRKDTNYQDLASRRLNGVYSRKSPGHDYKKKSPLKLNSSSRSPISPQHMDANKNPLNAVFPYGQIVDTSNTDSIDPVRQPTDPGRHFAWRRPQIQGYDSPPPTPYYLSPAPSPRNLHDVGDHYTGGGNFHFEGKEFKPTAHATNPDFTSASFVYSIRSKGLNGSVSANVLTVHHPAQDDLWKKSRDAKEEMPYESTSTYLPKPEMRPNIVPSGPGDTDPSFQTPVRPKNPPTSPVAAQPEEKTEDAPELPKPDPAGLPPEEKKEENTEEKSDIEDFEDDFIPKDYGFSAYYQATRHSQEDVPPDGNCFFWSVARQLLSLLIRKKKDLLDHLPPEFRSLLIQYLPVHCQGFAIHELLNNIFLNTSVGNPPATRLENAFKNALRKFIADQISQFRWGVCSNDSDSVFLNKIKFILDVLKAARADANPNTREIQQIEIFLGHISVNLGGNPEQFILNNLRLDTVSSQKQWDDVLSALQNFIGRNGQFVGQETSLLLSRFFPTIVFKTTMHRANEEGGFDEGPYPCWIEGRGIVANSIPEGASVVSLIKVPGDHYNSEGLLLSKLTDEIAEMAKDLPDQAEEKTKVKESKPTSLKTESTKPEKPAEINLDDYVEELIAGLNLLDIESKSSVSAEDMDKYLEEVFAEYQPNIPKRTPSQKNSDAKESSTYENKNDVPGQGEQPLSGSAEAAVYIHVPPGDTQQTSQNNPPLFGAPATPSFFNQNTGIQTQALPPQESAAQNSKNPPNPDDSLQFK